jgi:hypothetical protein
MTTADSTAGAQQSKSGHLDAILNGVFALAGVLIGAFVTAGVTYLGDRNDRIADQRTAERVIAAEIRNDAAKLFFVHVHGRLGKNGPPVATAWNQQASTLARDANNDVWADVADFYYKLATVMPSLSTSGIGCDTWKYANQTARAGNVALAAMNEKRAQEPEAVTPATQARMRACG